MYLTTLWKFHAALIVVCDTEYQLKVLMRCESAISFQIQDPQSSVLITCPLLGSNLRLKIPASLASLLKPVLVAMTHAPSTVEDGGADKTSKQTTKPLRPTEQQQPWKVAEQVFANHPVSCCDLSSPAEPWRECTASDISDPGRWHNNNL